MWPLLIVGGVAGLFVLWINRRTQPAALNDRIASASVDMQSFSYPGTVAVEADPPLPRVDQSAGAGVMQPLGSIINSVSSVFRACDRAAPYRERIAAESVRYGLPDGLLERVLYQESRFRPDIISGATRSPVGAMGIAQFMPATAAELGIDPLNPDQAIEGAARYLKKLRGQTGSWSLAVAAYNWGVGNVLRKGIDQAPAKTRNYVAQVGRDVNLEV